MIDDFNSSSRPRRSRKIKPQKSTSPNVASSAPSNQPQKPPAHQPSHARHTAAKDRPSNRPRRFWYDKRWSTKRKVIFWTTIAFVSGALLFGGWYTYRLSSSTSGIFTGSYLDVFKSQQPLERDEYGRSNVLVFGTSEGTDNSATLLTDSILVVSINQDSKDGNIISIPRDLWVEYGQQCPNGTEGKINATYSCGIQNGLSEIAASEAFADTVGQIIGTDIQYIVKVNQTVLKEVVDALGGIQVVVESPDPRGIYDIGANLRLANGPTTLDGQTALDFSRARNARGGYGLPRSNFNREQNQQKVIRAIQQKALSTGTLANPGKVLSLADSLGNNVVTTLPSRQVRTVIDVARGTNADNIESIDLADPKRPLVTTGQQGSQSIVLPTAGLFDYTQIHETIEKSFTKAQTAREGS